MKCHTLTLNKNVNTSVSGTSVGLLKKENG
jgi:hypothetical protein